MVEIAANGPPTLKVRQTSQPSLSLWEVWEQMFWTINGDRRNSFRTFWPGRISTLRILVRCPRCSSLSDRFAWAAKHHLFCSEEWNLLSFWSRGPVEGVKTVERNEETEGQSSQSAKKTKQKRRPRRQGANLDGWWWMIDRPYNFEETNSAGFDTAWYFDFCSKSFVKL